MATKTKRESSITGKSVSAKRPTKSIVATDDGLDDISKYLEFESPEDIARDIADWRAIVADTTDEQLAELERMFIEEEKRAEPVLLDFKGKCTISKTTEGDRAWESYYELPVTIQQRAKKSYQVFRIDPYHSSLNFERLSPSNLWSVRIGLHYRALGRREGDTIIWHWIGTHEVYNKLTRKG